jgi:hypothetical protein
MDTTSVAYVLCRIEDDSSLTLVSEHEELSAGIKAGRHIRVCRREFCELRLNGVLGNSALSWCSDVLCALAHIHSPHTRVC